MDQKIQELRQYESDRNIDEKVIDVIVATTNLQVNKKKVGEQKMCTFWDELRESGKNEGKIEGKTETMISLVRDGLLAVTEAAKRMQISESEFQTLMEQHLVSATVNK